MKKILTVILVTVMLALAGCAAELSQQEYHDKLMETYRTYNTELLDASAKLGINASSAEITAAADRAESALAGIEKLNPPAIYSAQHKAICEAMQTERSWLETVRKIAADGNSDELLDQLATYADSSDFHSQVFSAIKRMREDGIE